MEVLLDLRGKMYAKPDVLQYPSRCVQLVLQNMCSTAGGKH